MWWGKGGEWLRVHVSGEGVEEATEFLLFPGWYGYSECGGVDKKSVAFQGGVWCGGFGYRKDDSNADKELDESVMLVLRDVEKAVKGEDPIIRVIVDERRNVG